MSATPATKTDGFDLITHSPDGESRGLDFRVGDLFPMEPRPHQLAEDRRASLGRETMGPAVPACAPASDR